MQLGISSLQDQEIAAIKGSNFTVGTAAVVPVLSTIPLLDDEISPPLPNILWHV